MQGSANGWLEVSSSHTWLKCLLLTSSAAGSAISEDEASHLCDVQRLGASALGVNE